MSMDEICLKSVSHFIFFGFFNFYETVGGQTKRLAFSLKTNTEAQRGWDQARWE